MKTLAWRAFGTAILLASVCPAGAQQPTQAQTNAIRQACRADYQAHCASVPTGGSAALQCLQQNAAALSGACQQALGAISGGGGSKAGTANAAPSAASPSPPAMSRRQETAMLRTDCGPDYRHYCSDVQPGGGRVIACLQAHGPQLSRQCSSALLAARQGQ